MPLGDAKLLNHYEILTFLLFYAIIPLITRVEKSALADFKKYITNDSKIEPAREKKEVGKWK